MMTHARVTAPKGRIPRARVSHINQTDRHRLLIILAQVQGNNRQSKNVMNVILSCRVQNLRHHSLGGAAGGSVKPGGGVHEISLVARL